MAPGHNRRYGPSRAVACVLQYLNSGGLDRHLPASDRGHLDRPRLPRQGRRLGVAATLDWVHDNADLVGGHADLRTADRMR
jgi:hypothetical protein